MKIAALSFLFFVGLLMSCDLKQDAMARRSLDSLKAELLVNHNLAEVMVDVGVLMDSIDANRHVLHTRMVEGTSYESYVARLRDINQYVVKTQRKLLALEKTVKKSNDKAYQSAIKKLRADLDLREHEVMALNEQVNRYKNENDNLLRTVSLQKSEIQDKLEQIKIKQEETTQLQNQVSQLLVKSRLDEGESYYARAVAVEETANRTKFAPKKKKNTMTQALELYRMAQFYGKDGAEAKVQELEKRLSKSRVL